MGPVLAVGVAVAAGIGATIAASRRNNGPNHAPGEQERREAEAARMQNERDLEEERRRAEQIRRQIEDMERRRAEEERRVAELLRQQALAEQRRREMLEEARLREQQAEEQHRLAMAKMEEEAAQLQEQHRQQQAEADAEKARLDAETARLETERAAAQQQAEQLARDLQEQQAESARIEAETARLQRALEEDRRKEAERQALLARKWPRAAWLPQEGVTIGFAGQSGTGKSSLVNAIRGLRPGHPDAAPVGIQETTMEPTVYAIQQGQLAGAFLIDLPGSGTARIPTETYIKQYSIRYFWAIVVVSATRFTSMDLALFVETRRHGVPCYLVRTKADVDFENNEYDRDMEPAQTLEQIRAYILQEASRDPEYPVADADRIFVISSRPGRYADILRPEFERLMATMQQDLQRAGSV